MSSAKTGQSGRHAGPAKPASSATASPARQADSQPAQTRGPARGRPAAGRAAPQVEIGPAALALRLDQQVCFPLYAAAHLATRLYRPLLAPLGLTYPQYLAMLVLWERSPVSVGELGQRLLLDSGTLTPLLKRLEAAGLVSRNRAPLDERRVMIDLTPAGHQLRQRASGIPEAMCASLGLGTQDLLQLRDALKKVVADLSAAQAHRRAPPGSDAPPG